MTILYLYGPYQKWYMCSKCGFGIIISEGIIDYALIVMLLIQCNSRRVVRDVRQDQAR